MKFRLFFHDAMVTILWWHIYIKFTICIVQSLNGNKLGADKCIEKQTALYVVTWLHIIMSKIVSKKGTPYIKAAWKAAFINLVKCLIAFRRL